MYYLVPGQKEVKKKDRMKPSCIDLFYHTDHKIPPFHITLGVKSGGGRCSFSLLVLFFTSRDIRNFNHVCGHFNVSGFFNLL